MRRSGGMDGHLAKIGQDAFDCLLRHVFEMKSAQNEIDILLKEVLCFFDDLDNARMGAAGDDDQSFRTLDDERLLTDLRAHFTGGIHIFANGHRLQHFGHFSPN